MSGDSDEAVRLAALAREVASGGELLAAALRELLGSPRSVHPPLVLLATGLERLLKTAICLVERRRQGRFPERRIFPAGHRGHGLHPLVPAILRAVDEDPSLGASGGVRAAAVLRETRVDDLLRTVSVYAQHARYYDLDIALGRHSDAGSPGDHWRAFCDRLAAPGAARRERLTRLLVRVTGALLRLVQLAWPASAAPPAPVTGAELVASPDFVLRATADGRLRGHFPALDAMDGVVHAVTTRAAPELAGEVDDPSVVRAAAGLARELDLAEIAWMRQVHGDRVAAPLKGGVAGEADALATRHAALGLLARSADCPLVLLAGPAMAARAVAQDSEGPVVGVAHASWRGTVAGVTPRLLTGLLAASKAPAAEFAAAVAPSAGPCCYAVGEEVRRAMRRRHGDAAESWFHRVGDRIHLDLWRANADQLHAAGIPRQRIHIAGICTLCRNDLFPSHRAEAGAAGRFGAVIGRRADSQR